MTTSTEPGRPSPLPRLLLTIFRPIAQFRIGPFAWLGSVTVAVFTLIFHPAIGYVILAVPAIWLAIGLVWWPLYRHWVRRELRDLGFRRTDVPVPLPFGETERWDMTGGDRAFAEDRKPATPSFTHATGHAVVVAEPERGSNRTQVGVWATPVRPVDLRPWWRDWSIHPKGWTYLLTFVHVRLDHAVPGFIFRDRHVIDVSASEELDLESIDLARARRFVLAQGEQPIDVAMAVDPPTIELLLANPYLEIEAFGHDLVVMDPRGPLRGQSPAQLLPVAQQLRTRIDRASIA